MHQPIATYWRGLMDALDATRVHAAAAIADELFACYRRGGTVFIVGNGGSAATATHFACDLAKGTRGDGPRPSRSSARLIACRYSRPGRTIPITPGRWRHLSSR